MKTLIALFVIWVIGSICTFKFLGTGYIIPYALVTMALFALAVWLAGKKPKPPTTLNSFALPLLFLVNFHLSGWVLLGLLFVAVWAWALTRKASGDYDFGPGFALVGALVFSVACVIGVGFGLLLK
jgi:hypothetical protein